MGGRGRGGFPGGRGGNYGVRSNGSSNFADYEHTSDAVVLQEAVQADVKFTSFNGGQALNQKTEYEENTSSAGGRMQRVGDKWVFVRSTAMDVS